MNVKFFVHTFTICRGIHCVSKTLDAHLLFRCLGLILTTYFIQSLSYLVGLNRFLNLSVSCFLFHKHVKND